MLRSIFAKQHTPLLAGLALGSAAALYLSQSQPVRSDAPGGLNPEDFVSLPVQSTEWISKDTKELVLKLPDGKSSGGQTAFMVFLKTVLDGNVVGRPYTPVSRPDTVGSLKFVIKVYEKGQMTQFISKLKEGDKVDVKGPIQKYKLERNQHKKIGLLGGGTGITPLFQILQKIADDPEDKTEVELFYSNKTPGDVLIKKEIEELIAKKPDQLKAYLFVGNTDGQEWKGETGRITKDFLEKNLFKPSEENVKVFVCGPPGFYKAFSGEKEDPVTQGELSGALKEIGFNADQVFKF